METARRMMATEQRRMVKAEQRGMEKLRALDRTRMARIRVREQWHNLTKIHHRTRRDRSPMRTPMTLSHSRPVYHNWGSEPFKNPFPSSPIGTACTPWEYDRIQNW